MYTIKRFSVRNLQQINFGLTTNKTVGNWKELLDSEIYNGAKRVNDPVLGRYNQEWICDPNCKIKITESSYFISDLNKRSKGLNVVTRFMREVIKRYKSDLLNGYVYTDNPNKDPKYSDKTHFLSNLSSRDRYMVYSKSINEYNKLVYKVYKPIRLPDGNQELEIELINCLGHKFMNKSYIKE